MKFKIVYFQVVFFMILLVVTGCKKASEQPVLKEIGPAKTIAGKVFNVQPDGEAAMWAITENAAKDTVIVWGEKKLNTAYVNPKLITASVPRELYAKPGQYQIYLLDIKTGLKSKNLVFTVTQ